MKHVMHLFHVWDVLYSSVYMSQTSLWRTMINIVTGAFLTNIQPDISQMFEYHVILSVTLILCQLNE